VQYGQALLAEFRIADGDEQVVLELLEDLEPAFTQMTACIFGGVPAAHKEDLHVIIFQ